MSAAVREVSIIDSIKNRERERERERERGWRKMEKLSQRDKFVLINLFVRSIPRAI
jgi:hypothetical protein